MGVGGTMSFLRKEKWMIKKLDALYERCVVCHKIIFVRRDIPTDRRDCYVEGAGQLCKRCYEKIYGKRDMHNEYK